MAYKPRPIDTSKIEFNKATQELAAKLAENTHELWAAKRLRDGWTLGRKRSDDKLEHPCLVAYEALPASEKAYDIEIVEGTLKAAIALGFKISPVNTDVPGDTMESESVRELIRLLGTNSSLKTRYLQEQWRKRDATQWARHIDLYRAFAERLLREGQYLTAYDVTTEGLTCGEHDLRLRQLRGLALARCGATQEALELARDIQTVKHPKVSSRQETLGLLARTCKDLWLQGRGTRQQKALLERAYRAYLDAHRKTRGYWTAVNAATLARLLGKTAAADRLTNQVIRQCTRLLKTREEGHPERYWLLATLGEAYLVNGDRSRALDWYAQAGQAAGRQYGSVASTLRNARPLLDHFGWDSEELEGCFPTPTVLVFSGHALDRRERRNPRFPSSLEKLVKQAIVSRVSKFDDVIAYSSAACGADILFLETVRELKGEYSIILPYERSQFIVDSVQYLRGSRWKRRFHALVEGAVQVTTISPERFERGSLSYEFANRVSLGLAKIHATQLGAPIVPIAVWDGKDGDGRGGTASVVAAWKAREMQIEHIDTTKLLHAKGLVSAGPTRTQTRSKRGMARKLADESDLAAMLFADVKGFSRLREDQIKSFTTNFLGRVGKLIDGSRHQSIMRNTWGDGLFFVFDRVDAAGYFALELCDLIGKVRWEKFKLPRQLSIRIALHAGPVYRFTDPITGHPNFIGTHVSRAARIEPITPEGRVFASQEYAALIEYHGIDDIECNYVGEMPMAKSYGVFPTFNVRRRVR